MKSQIRTVPYRRRRENKTDYKKRLALLKSNKHRFVIRKSLKHLIVQIIDYKADGDKVLLTVSSSELKKLGWKHSTSNIPAAYLVGLLCGKKAQNLKIKNGVLDLGVNISIKGSRLYAALKGLIDSGISIPVNEEVFPDEERLSGKHIEKFRKIELEKDFNQIKNKILE